MPREAYSKLREAIAEVDQAAKAHRAARKSERHEYEAAYESVVAEVLVPALMAAVEFAVEDLPAGEVMRFALQLDARLEKNGE